MCVNATQKLSGFDPLFVLLPVQQLRSKSCTKSGLHYVGQVDIESE